MDAMGRRDKADRKLLALKEEYLKKLDESKTSKAQLEAALLKTGFPVQAPQNTSDRNQSHQQGMHLYNRTGEIVDYVANSIALECQTRFVPIENLQSVELSRIANNSFMKVYTKHAASGGRTTATPSTIKSDEDRVFEDIDKIMKEFEQKNNRHQ